MKYTATGSVSSNAAITATIAALEDFFGGKPPPCGFSVFSGGTITEAGAAIDVAPRSSFIISSFDISVDTGEGGTGSGVIGTLDVSVGRGITGSTGSGGSGVFCGGGVSFSGAAGTAPVSAVFAASFIAF